MALLHSFQVRYSTQPGGGGLVTTTLLPAPTEVEYPEKRLFNRTNTQDGWVVIQRPLNDDRSRKWIWRGYRQYITTYENQWKAFEEWVDARSRLQRGLVPWVEFSENVSGVGGFENFVKVRAIQVDRQPRDGGGPPTYEHSTIEFVVVDAAFSHF